MSSVIDMIVNGIKWAFDTLEDFEFLGINMLEFSITILIISAFLPIILTLIGNAGIHRAEYSIKEEKIREKSENKKGSRWI